MEGIEAQSMTPLEQAAVYGSFFLLVVPPGAATAAFPNAQDPPIPPPDGSTPDLGATSPSSELGLVPAGDAIPDPGVVDFIS